jgi:hypothetical protein
MVMWLQGTEDETEPAGVAGLFDGLSEAERRAAMTMALLATLCPAHERAANNRLDGVAHVWRECFDLLCQEAG